LDASAFYLSDLLSIVVRALGAYSRLQCTRLTKSARDHHISKMVGPTGKASAKIRYKYVVSNHSYTGQHVSFAHSAHILLIGLESIVKCYRKGTRVWVYFDPKNPQKAVLEKGIPPEIYAFPIGSFLFLVIGIFCYHYLNREQDKKAPAL